MKTMKYALGAALALLTLWTPKAVRADGSSTFGAEACGGNPFVAPSCGFDPDNGPLNGPLGPLGANGALTSSFTGGDSSGDVGYAGASLAGSLSEGSLYVESIATPTGSMFTTASVYDTLTFSCPTQECMASLTASNLSMSYTTTGLEDFFTFALDTNMNGVETTLSCDLGGAGSSTCSPWPSTLILSFPVSNGETVIVGAVADLTSFGGEGVGSAGYIDPSIYLTATDGATFTSASGVFPSSPAPVPEPASLLLLGSGLTALGGFRKRWIKTLKLVAISLFLVSCLLLPSGVWAQSYNSVQTSIEVYGGGLNDTNTGCAVSTGASTTASCSQPAVSGTSASLGLPPVTAGPLSASASLSDASLQVSATSVTDPSTTVILGSTADLADTLYFSGNISAAGFMQVSASGLVTGNAQVDLDLNLQEGNFLVGDEVSNIFSNTDCPVSTNNPASFGTSTVSCSGSDTALTINQPIPLSAPMEFSIVLACGVENTASNPSGSCNFTDPITLILPSGVTFTSESGVFSPTVVTEGTVATPEPSSVFLLSAGLLGLIGMALTSKRLA